MAAVLDPAGDPLLDPDGLAVEEPSATSAEIIGAHLAIHGGDFDVSFPVPTSGLYDPFTRADVNPPPFGGTYSGDSDWEIDGGTARSVTDGVKALLYETGDTNADVSVTIAAAVADANILAGNGVALAWLDATHHVLAVAREQAGTGEVALVARNSSTVGTVYGSGIYDVGLPIVGGRLRAVLTEVAGSPDEGVVDVYWNGVLLDSVSAPIGTSYDLPPSLLVRQGIYSSHAEGALDDLLIAALAPTIAAGHLAVRGGTVDVSLAAETPTMSASHIAMHGGAVATPELTAPTILPAHLAIHSGVIVGVVGPVVVAAAHLSTRGGTVMVMAMVRQLSLGGGGRYPIGMAPPLADVSIMDEGGDMLGDEGGDVLIFD